MRNVLKRLLVVAIAIATAGIVNGGCGGVLLNPSFVNTLSGGVVPVTPGPGADFILVRVINATTQNLQFTVTIEREVFTVDDEGNVQVDENGNFITNSVLETYLLDTGPTGNATELGILFSCEFTPVTRIGLGENLLPTDSAVFVGGGGAGGAQGFGVPAGDLNPLELSVGNYNCGDTVIFRAFIASGVSGGVGLQSLLLPGSEQPSEFSGPDTFVNLQEFLESQAPEDE